MLLALDCYFEHCTLLIYNEFARLERLIYDKAALVVGAE